MSDELETKREWRNRQAWPPEYISAWLNGKGTNSDLLVIELRSWADAWDDVSTAPVASLRARPQEPGDLISKQSAFDVAQKCFEDGWDGIRLYEDADGNVTEGDDDAHSWWEGYAAGVQDVQTKVDAILAAPSGPLGDEPRETNATLTWEPVDVNTKDEFTAGSWVISDHADHWHLYFEDSDTKLTDGPFTFEQCAAVAERLQSILDDEPRETEHEISTTVIDHEWACSVCKRRVLFDHETRQFGHFDVVGDEPRENVPAVSGQGHDELRAERNRYGAIIEEAWEYVEARIHGGMGRESMNQLKAILEKYSAPPVAPTAWKPPLYEPKFADDDEAMKNMALVYEERRHVNHAETCARYFNADSRVACDCGGSADEHTHLFGMWLPAFEETPERWLAFDYCPSCGKAIPSAPPVAPTPEVLIFTTES